MQNLNASHPLGTAPPVLSQAQAVRGSGRQSPGVGATDSALRAVLRKEGSGWEG